MRFLTALVCALVLIPSATLGARSSYTWDPAAPVDTNTLLFGESPRVKKELSDVPDPSEKSYPWYCLEKGNDHFLNREYEKASIYFKAAYAVPGPTRVMSGFRLIDAYQKLDWVDLALDVLDGMEKKYLVSSREFREATRLRMELVDRKRRGIRPRKLAPLTGREWVLKLQEWRLRYVLGAMDKLRRHGVPLKEEAQGYGFLLDEYFIAHPETAADDAVKVLTDLVYERDIDARIPIDRWHGDPEGTVTEEAKVQEDRPKFTGAEWVTLIHEDKMDYVSGALKVLINQRVPMEKNLYAYVDAMDMFFTEKPEFPAYDSVKALATILYETEPEARKMIDVLRLE